VNPAPAAAADGPKTVGGWFASNLLPLAFVGGVIALIVWKGLVVWDVALAVLGLGLVIFIHELGHFLAAKLCDVHVETFSIGFGKAIPGCQFRYGETTYKVGWIPLGGYVKMVGEGDNADSEEADEDPRSFKNKSVWSRMFIISAGVVMNLILGCVCFMWAYSHGVEETPATVGIVVVGSPAWEHDLRAGDQITKIGDTEKPTFDDIRPTVMSASKGEGVPFTIVDRAQNHRSMEIVPRRNPEDLYPLVGINPIEKLVLQKSRRGGVPAVRKNSPAFGVKAVEEDTELKGGDKIVASSFDPARPDAIMDIPPDPREPTKLDTYTFLQNQSKMRGKAFTVRVDRDGKLLTFVVPPGETKVLPDVRFQMGRLAALRANGPASQAKAVGVADGGLQVAKSKEAGTGDKIIAVEITKANGTRRRYVDELTQPKPADVEEVPFDTFKLGYELEQWAESVEPELLVVRLTVLRPASGPGKTATRVTYDLDWDPALVFNGEVTGTPSTPLAISGLGLAYYVETTIDAEGPSPAGGLKKGDIVTEVRPRRFDEKGNVEPDDWLPLEQHQGAYLHALFQGTASADFDLKVTRGGATQEVAVTVVPDPRGWPAVERGFVFPFDTRLQKADNVWEALKMGLHRTKRTVIVIYQTLYATIFRQISPKTMSGPLSIANASYRIAGYDFWQFVIFIGLININLAVVNFLPIPLLDGGHMMFLIYEKVRGKPPPEKLVEWSLWVGLALILSLMVFVIFLDVRKLFF
jgi:regulator of sigma E protease